MTIKEISNFTKVSDRTIRRHIKLLFPGEMKRGQTTNLSDKQFEKLLEAMKTKGIIMQTGQIAEVTGQIAGDRIERVIESMNNLANAIFAHVKIQDSKISALERKFQKRVDALPAPVISVRNEINRIVREQVEAGEYDYRDIWHHLYSDFNYRMGRNFSLCAKNRNMKTIDYIDSEGLIGELLATARELFKNS